MFICSECLATHFKNWGSMSNSHGLCEFCDKARVCSDIPSKHLVPKEAKGEFVVDFLKIKVSDDVSIEIRVRPELGSWGQDPPYELIVFKKARKGAAMSETALGSKRLSNAAGKAVIEALKDQ